MALTEILNESMQTIMTWLREGETLSGIVIISLLLGGWLALQLKRETRIRRSAEYDDAQCLSESFACRTHAAAVWQYVNSDMYQYVLAELERTLIAEGYALTRDRAMSLILSDTCRNQVARATFLARERYFTPLRPESQMEEAADECSRNGYSAQWLACLLRGCELQGWYVTRYEQTPVISPPSDNH